jgi:hypothetical protein
MWFPHVGVGTYIVLPGENHFDCRKNNRKSIGKQNMMIHVEQMG